MSENKNPYKNPYPSLRSRSIGKRKYKSNTFNRYSPRARIVRLSILLGVIFIAFFVILGFLILPKLSFAKKNGVEVGALPTPEPTPNPYASLIIPNDTEFIEEMPSWVKTDVYGDPVLMRESPQDNGEIIMELVDKENITVYARTGDWYLVLYNKTYGFVKKKYIYQGPIPSVPPCINEIKVADLLSGVIKDTHLVNLQEVVPGIIVDMPLAKDENYVGTRMYPVQIAMLQSDTAEKLRRAQAHFVKDGYTLVIWDAYRPYSTTLEMYELFGDVSPLIESGRRGSRNNRGASVDVTLAKKDGTRLEMPSTSITLDEALASRRNKAVSEEAKANLDYLTGIMRQVGFDLSMDAWWHFDDSDWAFYPVMDYDLFDF